MSNLLFQQITHFIFDIDGVLTDGTVLVLENGVQARLMNVKDGYALQLAVKKGYVVMIVSGAAASPAIERLNKLGITNVNVAVTDKGQFVSEFIESNGITKENILFMGDDMPDLPVMSLVGIPSCPADAIEELKEAAAYVAVASGGKGCVREVIEKVLKARGDWDVVPGVASR
jgi:3-deoxy-D-manno-octulosonate 8-phosphate phosphatase (KDO 8-P phosphatase)